MNRYVVIMVWSVVMIPLTGAFGQGCSDAGFCSVGSFKHNPVDSLRATTIQLTLPFGIGDDDVKIFTPAIQYDHQFSYRWGIQVKVTGNHASGNLGTANGPGDLYLAGIHSIALAGNWKASFMAAWKFPLSRSALNMDGMDLPMVYQSSLGTVDLISGLSLTNNSWAFSLGWQHPLTAANRNNFSARDWDTPEADAYPETKDFSRKGDVLLRATYTTQISSAWTIQGGFLNIYHLSEDTYLDETGASSQRRAIAGSKGLTVNISGTVWMTITSGLKAGLTAAAPLAARDARPDGLTRSFVLSPELQWRIGQ